MFLRIYSHIKEKMIKIKPDCLNLAEKGIWKNTVNNDLQSIIVVNNEYANHM